MFRSQEFYDFLKPLGTKFLPTSVGAPWANSNAERSIKTIKQALISETKINDIQDNEKATYRLKCIGVDY